MNITTAYLQCLICHQPTLAAWESKSNQSLVEAIEEAKRCACGSSLTNMLYLGETSHVLFRPQE